MALRMVDDLCAKAIAERADEHYARAHKTPLGAFLGIFDERLPLEFCFPFELAALVDRAAVHSATWSRVDDAAG
jgi:hypothetical protein